MKIYVGADHNGFDFKHQITDFLRRAGSLNRTFDDRPFHLVQMPDNVVKRNGGDEAQVQRARHGHVRLGFEFGATDVEIDFLVAEPERQTACAEGFEFHLHDLRVEMPGRFGVDTCQDEMIEVIDQWHTKLLLEQER